MSNGILNCYFIIFDSRYMYLYLIHVSIESVNSIVYWCLLFFHFFSSPYSLISWGSFRIVWQVLPENVLFLFFFFTHRTKQCHIHLDIFRLLKDGCTGKYWLYKWITTKVVHETTITKFMQIPSLRHATKRVLCTKCFNCMEYFNYGIQQPLRPWMLSVSWKNQYSHFVCLQSW